MLDGAGVGDSRLIGYSVIDDRSDWLYGATALHQDLNAKFGDAWEREIARAFAIWTSAANINIVESDNPNNPVNAVGSKWSKYGDIRISGSRFGADSYLTQTHLLGKSRTANPIAGDIELNTQTDWRINGGSPDLETVALREIGAILGLTTSSDPSSIMKPNNTSPQGLSASDISAIQQKYGVRQADSFNQSGQGVSFDAPIPVTNIGQPIKGLDLTRIGETDYFTITIPANGGSTLEVTASSELTSVLSPKVRILDVNRNVKAEASSPSAWGTSVTARLNGVNPGERYLIAVTGATNDVFDVGAYELTANLPQSSNGPTTAPPTVTPTPTVTPPAQPQPQPAPVVQQPPASPPPPPAQAPAPAPVVKTPSFTPVNAPQPAPAPAPAPTPAPTPAPIPTPPSRDVSTDPQTPRSPWLRSLFDSIDSTDPTPVRYWRLVGNPSIVYAGRPRIISGQRIVGAVAYSPNGVPVFDSNSDLPVGDISFSGSDIADSALEEVDIRSW